MSRTSARLATLSLAAALVAGPVWAQQAQQPQNPPVYNLGRVDALSPAPPAPAAQTARTPADAATRAAYDRASPLERSVFWAEQAEINPNDVEAGVKAAQAMRELGRYQEGAETAQRVLLVQPQNLEAMLEVGRNQIARGQAFYGIQALEQARDLKPNDWRTYSLLGTAYEQVRRNADAQAAWSQALTLSPDNPDVLSNMAMSAMTGGDASTAEPLLQRAYAQPGASLRVKLNYAMALGLNGKLGEAEQVLRRVLPPEQADANLAWLRSRRGSQSADTARTWSSLQGG